MKAKKLEKEQAEFTDTQSLLQGYHHNKEALTGSMHSSSNDVKANKIADSMAGADQVKQNTT